MTNPYECWNAADEHWEGDIPCGSCDNCFYGKTQIFEEGIKAATEVIVAYLQCEADFWEGVPE